MLTGEGAAIASQNEKPKAKPLWGNRFTAWFLSMAVNLGLPLLPLGVEYALHDKQVSASNLVLAASMYSISTGVVSRNSIFLIFSLFACIFYIAVFGFSLSVINFNDSYNAVWVIGASFLINAMIKFKYHVIESQPYNDFSLRSE
ncbi:hypothetical protein JFT81_08385 [Pseudomonas sp. TH43]|uniref:hypothetical protein n=1 Tax=Pseudomonas sp. TH43 TaxID=2796407 RepID=UPI00191293FB|nr:hypothetical protein [Pseudomonas sp. TH43]MBK5374650.1 hypothetical protein [Pseudomonas sp. TH43]